MKKLLIAAVAILVLLFAPLLFEQYRLDAKIKQIQLEADKTVLPFKVFYPPTATVGLFTNSTKVQMAITDDGVVYYYGPSEYKPNLIEPRSFIVVQHAYIENSSGGGFATEKNGQKYYFFTHNGMRTLVFSKNTSYNNPTEINLIAAGTPGEGLALTDEPVYSREMIKIAESMR